MEPKPAGDGRVYCTQCKTDLEDFCFSAEAKDVEALRRKFKQCQESGRFMGDCCAKLFIMEDTSFFPTENSEDPQ
jgi:hypothetical protein